MILITGGAGFIGSALAHELVRRGERVTILDDFSAGKVDRLNGLREDIHVVPGSILDADLVDKEIRQSSAVYHMAAVVGVRNILKDRFHGLHVNVLGTGNVLSSCAKYDRPVVIASSSEVYGNLPVRWQEDGPRMLGPASVPRWAYAAAKAVDEHLMMAYVEQGLQAAGVRYFNIYGPGLNRSGDASVVAVFLRQAFAGVPISIDGNGQQTRCFTYIDDAVQGTLSAGNAAASGKIFNIGSTEETSIATLAAKIITVLGGSAGTRAYADFYGENFEDVHRRVPDISLARHILGWEAQVDLNDGLRRTISWWKNE